MFTRDDLMKALMVIFPVAQAPGALGHSTSLEDCDDFRMG